MSSHLRHPVLVASNRGPVSFSIGDDGALTARRGGGGMVSGLSSALAASATGGYEARGGYSTGGTALWVCAAMSDADRAAARHGVVAAGESPGDVPVLMLDIRPATFEAAYNSIANSVLWFVHHMLFDTPNQPHFGREFRADWAAYTEYNAAFAAALVEQAGPGSKILIQDYHLALAPRQVRDLRPEARVAHFSHTPWAPPAYFRMLPDDVATALLDGMLGADHLGFLAGRWADAFLACCAEVLGAEVSDSGASGRTVTYRGRTTTVAVHPLGVDAESLRERARRDDVQAHKAMLRAQGGERQLIVRVDRTELSKNIVRGLAAFRELLESRPQWRGKVSHLAFAYPSRSAIPEYQAYTERVRQAAREINEQFATPDWTPVVLEVKDDYARSLAACAVADVLLINPIRDGMNLVAEEGPILSERGCALVLSREAGAASLIGQEALLVNPYDVCATAAALHEALCLPGAERRRRSAAITAAASGAAPARWLAAQLAGLD
ncbi:MAG TPA: trehalose-6-phosphate synthase [Trebonia sp.]|nr:trehalose-6-phosphate synthase [Trebonia sp.]